MMQGPARTTANVKLIAGLAAATALGLVAWQIADLSGPDGTTIFALLVLLLAVVAWLNPLDTAEAARKFSQRMRSVSIAGVKIEVDAERLSRVTERFKPFTDDYKPKDRDDTGTLAEQVQVITKELKKKLRFARDAVLPEDRPQDEWNVIARLELEDVLERDEATLCRRFLNGDFHLDLEDWGSAERRHLLDGAWVFAYRFATEMFNRWARLRFREHGWTVADFERAKGRRADLLAFEGGQAFLVAARVADPAGKFFDTFVPNFAKRQPPIPSAVRVCVVPDRVDHLPEELDDGPLVLADGAVIVARLSRLLADPEGVLAATP